MGAMSETPKPDGATVERFRAVMLPHLDAAYGFARWLTRDPVVAQDVAQEAMLRALRYFHAFRGDEAKPWLLRIVRNTWTDMRAKSGAGDRPLEEIEADIIRLAVGEDQRKIRKVLHYTGLPVDARFVSDEILKLERATSAQAVPQGAAR